NLWGAGLADTSGTFTIDGWPPSGHKAQAYPASGTLPWNYTAGSGTQNLLLAGASDPYTADADIDVDKLLANAKNNGDAPVNKQGFHFKLQFSQDPQKHKTFWVDCPPPPPPPHPVDCDGDTDNSVAATDTACQPAKPTLDCDNDTDNTTASECSAVQPVTTTT